MTRLAGLARGIWEFVVGDDPRIAAGVVVAVGITAALGAVGVAAWWLMAVAVVALLALGPRPPSG